MKTAAANKRMETNILNNSVYLKLNSFILNNKRAFSFEIADRKYLLYTIDLILVLFASYAYCVGIEPGLTFNALLKSHIMWFVSISVLWSFFAYVFDLYSLEHINNLYTTLRYVFVAAVLTVASYIFIPWFTPPLPSSRLLVLLLGFNLTLSIIIWRYIYIRLLNKPLFLKRVIIVGSGWSTNALIDVFANGDIFNYHLGYKVVGVIDEESSEFAYKGIRILNKTQDLAKLVKRLKVDELIVDESSHKDDNKSFLAQLTRCRLKGVAVISLSDFYENLTGRVLVHNSGKDFHLAFPYNKNHFRNAYLFFSRTLDVAFGIVGVTACALLTPFVYLANLFCSPGPLFYSQERVGLYGKEFKITKFRSMVVDAERGGAAWAQKNDNRITKIGKFLRRARIDELPQAWSVLKGDMSLIGPRPERPVFVEQLKKEIPFYDTRHLAKPGITGWAQAIYKYGSNAEDALMKVQYDLYYLKNRSVLMDLKVLLKTISVVVRFKGM